MTPSSGHPFFAFCSLTDESINLYSLARLLQRRPQDGRPPIPEATRRLCAFSVPCDKSRLFPFLVAKGLRSFATKWCVVR